MNRLRKPALQGVGAGSRDLDLHEPSHEVGRTVEVDDPELRRPTRDAPVPVHRLDEDFLGEPDAPLVPPALPLLLVGVQEVESPPLLALGQELRAASAFIAPQLCSQVRLGSRAQLLDPGPLLRLRA